MFIVYMISYLLERGIAEDESDKNQDDTDSTEATIIRVHPWW